MRKIGMIFECGPEGADVKVCKYLAKRLSSEVDVEPISLTNKKILVAECGKAASILLESCECVLIIWDLYPLWSEQQSYHGIPKKRPCRKKDCDDIRNSLRQAGLTNQQLGKVHLICIERELEAWLLADKRAIISFLYKLTKRTCDVSDVKYPERAANPKTLLIQLMEEHTGRPYIDREHAEKIIKELPDFKKISRCKSFVRFKAKIMGPP